LLKQNKTIERVELIDPREGKTTETPLELCWLVAVKREVEDVKISY
jgi:hypothetical protein